MKLDQSDELLIQSREKMIGYWPMAGGLVSFLLIGLTVWLIVFHPLLANPFHVMSELDKGSIPASMLFLMAAILPFMTLATIGIMAALLLFAFISMRRERRYLELISMLRSESEHD
ncbi:MAG: hypothetical protein HKN33_19285 [Pyrinomonadaceae bacterium]|nr:hypothetical protein [Pyrinomonadaceae bacterium]